MGGIRNQRRASALPQIESHQISPSVAPSDFLPYKPTRKSPYFWGGDVSKKQKSAPPKHSGYSEARDLIGDGSLSDFEQLVSSALETIVDIFEGPEDAETASSSGTLVDMRLSDNLLRWRRQQHSQGRLLPSKGSGIKRTSDQVIKFFGMENWPAPLLTNSVVYGVTWANILIGAYDAPTLYSNICCDMAFFYEHGYNRVFPDFEPLLKNASSDPRAMLTPGGTERREATKLGITYIKGKVDLETKYQANLARKSAKVDRRTGQLMCFSEASLTGMAAEAIARGFDPAAVFSDMVFGSPGTDVLDVGSDIHNSEVMNSFLNTADITNTGIVSEEALRRVYDAYAHTSGRMFTERWDEPIARMSSQLYIWHIKNDRHMFLRRALLGYSKVRRTAPDQREADFDEAFDVDYHTTGFSRPLQTCCDGRETCNHVQEFISKSKSSNLLAKLWQSLVTDPLQYARRGVEDGPREDEIGTTLHERLAECYNAGLVLETAWMTAHASHHAWQVNYLMEAAMFGSLLDDGGLEGKLDRAEA
ncbi:hypothetical protein ABW20_dc0109614 [Dactylellina cionopaga]|nr:hypothetical protein ABW20_dc0109614 [Dactylellina cionopaga]